ncbi:MAG TPA: tetratricopeptide repeat protein [Pyrinomonadaceae bacterium]|nr:tetratricopeptide repeat protein [Pyrinomonadaceae bacterium]
MGFDKTKAVRAAEKYLAQGKIPAAIQEYRRIVEHDAEDYSALNTLGDLYARVDKKQDAAACYKRVAVHYHEQGFALKAIAMYKKLTRFSAADHHTAMALAALYEQQGLMVDARAQYLTAADLYARAGETREALEVLRRISDLDPNNTDIRLRLAEGYLREDLPDLAAETYTLAGERLSSRGEYERALEAYTNALALRPRAHAALQGLVAVHSALGTADEAAEVIEAAIAGSPGDLELRAMLARAYVEAENAPLAERAVEELLRSEPSSYMLSFDVVRLYLQQGNLDQAARMLGEVVEAALSGGHDDALLELLQEILGRDPEQMAALHLLVRVHAWQRDDERQRTALERLADAAETAGMQEEERKALAQLVRLAPDEPRYAERLKALGGPVPGDEGAEESTAGQAGNEVPTFESFMLGDDAFAAPAAAAPTQDPQVTEFDWSIAKPPGDAGAGVSFADLNDGFADGGTSSYDISDAAPTTGEPPVFTDFQEVDFTSPAPAHEASESGANASSGERAVQMLLRELESVDFYIGQGYADIARDTLEMLEGQYGPHEEIEARRRQLPSDDSPPAAPVQVEAEDIVAEAPEQSFEFTEFSSFDMSQPFAEAETADAQTNEYEIASSGAAHDETPSSPAPEPPQTTVGSDRPASSPASSSTTPAGGIDPGLAAIFDEFRDAVEDTDAPPEADYETHYNLGLAYREMGLLDQAIEELQSAIGATAPGDGTPRYLQCCNMLGHCFMEKGLQRAAVMWFRKGLDAPGHTEDEYQALRYELGTAYEQMGDLGRAIEVFTEVYGIDVSYRGVSNKLRDLQAQKAGN